MTWEPIDLSGITDEVAAGIDGRPEPALLTREDGAGLLYPGMVNGLHGESGSGKTWLALHACAQEMRAGHAVAYIDHEGDPRSIVARLMDLQVTADQIVRHFRYSQPETPFSDGAGLLLTGLQDEEVRLVVIDSTGEGLALAGAKPNADDEVARWFREVPRRIADHGPSVLLLDHSAKAAGGELWPIGSQRKRAAVNGAQYYIETLSPFGRDRPGAAKLVCAKDRHGRYIVGQQVATLHVTPGDRLRITLAAPEPTERADHGGFRPTMLMERISSLLEREGALSSARIEQSVTGRREVVRRALTLLVDEGNVTRSHGARGALVHTLSRPFTTSPRTRGEVINGDLDWPVTAGARSNVEEPPNHMD
ncbi:AAA family ATPase [Microbacterium terregens]|uniref:AAA family ATPase n=1 Tax=Microbacterium terregens TaxID=69363 RepID=A0ABV5SXR9_9MICO